MIFQETKLQGVFEIDVERKCDNRGFFARTWCRSEFANHGLAQALVQCSISFNTKAGTLRGVHYQVAPFQETKVVRCTSGSIYDVAVDLRPHSPTFRQWVGVVLSAANRKTLCVAEGCAHGFITLEDDSEVLYEMSEFYDLDSARGVRWNDPAFAIAWPRDPAVMSERDRTYPDFAF